MSKLNSQNKNKIMSNKLPKDYPLYDTVYGSEIPTEQYYVIRFDKLPSKFIDNLSYDPTIVDYLINHK